FVLRHLLRFIRKPLRLFRRNRIVTSTITPALFQKKLRGVSTNSSRNSSATLRTRSWSRCFQKCRATTTSPLTRSACIERGKLGRKDKTTALFCWCSLLIAKCASTPDMAWKELFPTSPASILPRIALNRIFGTMITRADWRKELIPFSKPFAVNTQELEKQRASDRAGAAILAGT